MIANRTRYLDYTMRLYDKKNFFQRNKFRLQYFLTISLSIFIILTQEICPKKLANQFFERSNELLDNVINPFYRTIKDLKIFFETKYNLISEKEELIFENKILRKQCSYDRVEIEFAKAVIKENNKLRKLLNLSELLKGGVITAEVILNIKTPYTNQILFDRGLYHGIKVGQVVLNEHGVVGQVIFAGKLFSRALLICDTSHAIPVQCERNGVRMIAFGNGYGNDLKLDSFSENHTFQQGDVLVTSGLGGKFPRGYPVALISHEKHGSTFSKIEYFAKPMIDLQKLDFIVIAR
ncbi:rod shape-determining protein MreC [Candidatus Riesia pediculischaeffi]|uniref:Cell shape-determining protein MreC n=1 Tax=Candidatus Riesia pediculischaeffi TaxID=428411 RepID=A0A1V0HLB1_9ENTR|nr:rod shape-determining protein MreC [Candidatus Riesia pediculischaeffi]ARC53501.1 hypothetical protein AOQ87_02545 [Candidatus Riesia pediculischaeffi]